MDVERLRSYAWEIGARQARRERTAPASFVALAAVSPGEALACWRIARDWLERAAQQRGDAWRGSRQLLRLYDVTLIQFNGLNAHRIRDVSIDGLQGERLFKVPLAGTCQLAEVGFLLRSGEFLPCARAAAVQFPPAGASPRRDRAALHVDGNLRAEPVASPWEAGAFLRERLRKRLSSGLGGALGQDGEQPAQPDSGLRAGSHDGPSPRTGFLRKEQCEMVTTTTALATRERPLRELGPPAPESSPGLASGGDALPRAALCILCREEEGSSVGKEVAREATALAKLGRSVYLYCRTPFSLTGENLIVRHVGGGGTGSLLDEAHDFSRRAVAALEQDWGLEGTRAVVLGHEWSTVPALLEARSRLGMGCLLSLSSLERQRSDMRSELNRRIEEIEKQGLERASAILVSDPATAEKAKAVLPGCQARMVWYRRSFPVEELATGLDPGKVKARYQVGPIDPTLVFVGELDEAHGPDLIMKAMPAILKNHRQARLVLVGDGPLLWALRVQARYMLLEQAVRIIGHREGKEVRELIAAADVVLVPSRSRTQDWPILAGWADSRAVVATHQAGESLCRHEQDSIVIYSNPQSCAWGVERLLNDPALGRRLGAQGRARLLELHGSKGVALQLENLLELHRSTEHRLPLQVAAPAITLPRASVEITGLRAPAPSQADTEKALGIEREPASSHEAQAMERRDHKQERPKNRPKNGTSRSDLHEAGRATGNGNGSCAHPILSTSVRTDQRSEEAECPAAI
jgi:glycosyltransferase involved in cell wall biosynthesis